MNKTLTRLFTIALLMMVSMGAWAEVKVLFGEKGTDKYEGKGGTIQVKQEESRDGGKVTVRLAFIPDKNYTFDEQSLEVYKVFSPESATARALEIDGDALKLEEDKSTNPSEKHYHVDIDSKLALRVKEAQFINMRKSGDPITVTYHIINLGRLNDSGQLTDNRTEALQFTVTGDNVTVGVPDKYKSPLAKNWVYYSSSEVTFDATTKECTFNSGPSLSVGDALSDGDHVYVAYELDEDALTTVGLADGGVYRIQFANGKYFSQTIYNSEFNANSYNTADATESKYLLQFNIKDPYQITLQTKSDACLDYYLSSTSKGNLGDVRFIDGLSNAKNNKVWAFALLNGGTTGTYRLIVADGYTQTANSDERDEFGHGYLNNKDSGYKIRYQKYGGSSYTSCDLTFPSLNVNYTYNIVDTQGNIAIKYAVSHAAGKTLSGYADIPEAIRSPYIENETVTFYSTLTGTTLSDPITHSPVTGGNIYISYTTSQLKDKPLHLRGQRGFLMQVNGEYVYDDGGTLGHTSSTSDIANSNYFWKFSGQDPYRVQIQNVSTDGRYLNWTTTPSAALSLDASSNSYFILMGGNVVRPDGVPSGQTDQIELMAATGADISSNAYYNVGRASDVGLLASGTYGHENAAVQVLLKADERALTFHIIDKSGKIIIEQNGSYGDLAVPAQWRSPLVSAYHYYKYEDFTVSNGVYTLNGTPAEIPTLANAPADVYVTYDVGTAIDLDGGLNRDNEGKMYMLKFAHGQSYQLEDGSDGLSGVTKAVYPYNNGEANLYVYDGDRWVHQQGEAASTRTRWAWYLESSGNDPYHVKVSSFQTYTLTEPDKTGETGKHLYLRTYVPSTSIGVVTGVTTTHSAVATRDANDVPTEYMILGTTGAYKLMTTAPVDDLDGDPSNDIRQTVTSFESYWKNNPTVKNVLTAAGKGTPTTDIDPDPDNAQRKYLEQTMGWHEYEAWGSTGTNDAGTGAGNQWTSTKNKRYKYEKHWFLKVDMQDGEFDFEEVEITGALILLDNHGWEIMRKPTAKASETSVKPARDAAIRVYDSPMVERYHFYYNFSKRPGYHKYYPTTGQSKDADNYHEVGTGTSLADYTNFESALNNNGTLRDVYVIYDANKIYSGTEVSGGVPEFGTRTEFIIQQGRKYATNSGGVLTPVNVPADGFEKYETGTETPTDDMLWYLQPNLYIDREMGLIYSGEDGAQDYAPTMAEQEEAYVTGDETGTKNGFDPYNVQIASKANPTKVFITNATSGVEDSNFQLTTLNKGDGITRIATGSTTLSLGDGSTEKYDALDHDSRTVHVTNGTFMIVKDANGNMRLMPRFDHTVVAGGLATMATPDAAATPGDNGMGSTQTTLLFTIPRTVSSSSEITSMSGHYTLAEGFTSTASIGSEENPFTGSIDGQLHTISGLSHPFIVKADGATIKNVILDNVTISSGDSDGNTGAIACVATGATRIYNCGILGGSVGGSGDVGGIVGSLDGSARVINCYSYATITGGNNVGGIVGNNKGTTTASNINTMVMNCMFYGDITGGTTVSPVFGGNNIDNRKDGSVSGLNTFNFYAYDKLKTQTIDSYNSTLAVEERFLTRFEFYRLLLNSNKKLAAYYATGSVGNSSQMFKWVLETADRTITDPKPYPILKVQGTYPSIINPDVENAPDSASVGRNKGGKLGKTLSVTIYTKSQKTTGGQSWPTATTCDVQTTSLTLVRTDMDAERFNFNYDKVQLPYYNDVGSGNYTEGRVVTGWKIVSMEGGTEGTYTASDSWGGYNFADRNCTKKDLYSVSGRVFAQGAYFDVPYGVTAITIEPYWGYASFVADERYDVVYDNSYGSKTGVTAMGKQVDSWTFNGVSVKTDINSAFSTITTKGTTVYDNAVVLVGNFHQANINNTSPFKDGTPFTLMSVDLDNDNEPDYSLIYHDNNRSAVCPIRFDFLNIIGTAQAQKPYSSSTVLNASVFNAKAWFEITNTCLIYFSQFEYENSGKTADKSPIILLGGVFDQFTSTKVNQVQNTTYLHVGGNAWFNDFGNGTHSDGNKSTKHIPISVTGGDYRGFYLTGTYNQSAAMLNDDAECYISGGHFGEAAGAGQEQIGGNVHWQIYNADIDNFYGGGVNHAKPILGTVTVDIMYSHVGTYCGGPKFGNMSVDKTVKTNATGCTFGTYFGAGFGGTSYSRVKYRDEADGMDFNSWQNLYATSNGDRGKYYDGTTTDAYGSHKDYGKKGPGVAVDFDYEFFVWTTGKTGGRFFVKFASFSLAQCDDVESKLKKCIIENNYYGGGSLGKVAGTVTSELEDCTVKGNVFGAGYSASLPTLQVRDAGFETIPSFNKYSGMFQPGVPAKPTANDLTGTTKFEWKHVNTFAGNGQKDIEEDGSPKYVHTDANLSTSNLGSVSGAVTLTITGNSEIGTEGDATTGNVYGGGDESYVTNATTPADATTTVNISGNTLVYGDVFGGGNRGLVSGNTTVNIRKSEPEPENP